MKRPSVLHLGVVGLPPDWESRFVPTLARMEQRVRVRAFYDSQPARASVVADDTGVDCCSGLRELLQIQDLNAILLLNSSWHRQQAVKLILEAGSPLYVSEHVLRSDPEFSALAAADSSTESLIVPECLLRYEPSMLRLQELMATQVGSALTVTVSLPRAREQLRPNLSLCDILIWFRSAFRGIDDTFAVHPSSEPATSHPLPPLHASMLSRQKVNTHLRVFRGHEAEPSCEVECEGGRVTITGTREIVWANGRGDIHERLDTDRSSTDVALDLFSRRSAGGLIPVPSIRDLIQGRRMAGLLEPLVA